MSTVVRRQSTPLHLQHHKQPALQPCLSCINSVHRNVLCARYRGQTGLQIQPWCQGAHSCLRTNAYDPLRYGPLRYVAYANEVGEAFGTILSRHTVNLTYLVAFAYILVDTCDKGMRALRTAASQVRAEGLAVTSPAGKDYSLSCALYSAAECFLWQTLASLIIPGLIIHKLVSLTASVMCQGLQTGLLQPAATTMASLFHWPLEGATAFLAKGIPTLVGLAAIPVIVHPIDAAVDYVFNVTLRPWLEGRMQAKRVAMQAAAGGSS